MNNKEVVERLDILISLLLPRFDPGKYSVKGIGMEILKMADGGHTVEDMTKKLKKSRQIIDNTLSKLRTQGLVRSITLDSKTYYIRLL
jgi:hypothetical protein